MEPPQMAGWNLAFRFAIEIAALVALGVAGAKLGAGVLSWVLAVVFPVVAAAAWTTFNVPGDPSRSGRAPVQVNGWMRLAVELAVLGAGVAALWYSDRPALALALGVSIIVHHAVSLDRIRWLVHQ